MRKQLKDFMACSLYEKCSVGLSCISVVIICLVIVNEPAINLSHSTRLVKNEMKQMGHHDAAQVVALEATNLANVYRATVPVQDENGVTIEYWQRKISPNLWFAHANVYVTPFYEYENEQGT